MNIYLIGFRCTGKTSVGRCLAGELGWAFADADAVLTEKAGMSTADIVAKHGWPYFRELEKGVLRELASGRRTVVATGGGVILDPENTALMAGSGFRVRLAASVETIRQRMSGDECTCGNRPSLTGKGAMDEISETLAEREPLYAAAADATVETDGRTFDEICGRLTEILVQHRIIEKGE